VSTLQGILLAGGAVLEFGGIVALAFPDFLPQGRRLSRWLTHRADLLINGIRLLLGLPPLHKSVSVETTDSVRVSDRASVLKLPRDDPIIEEKVAFLLERDQETQAAISTLGGRVQDLEEGTPRQLEQLREDLREHVVAKLASADEEYRALRIVGTIALAAGLACTTAASFV
jgi:hypothetical protein